MGRKASKSEKKVMYDEKLCKMLDEYTQILVVSADNVRSSQLQSIRNGLRGDSVLLMGKNTMMKRSIRIHSYKTRNTAFLTLVPLLVGNVGLIFTKGDLKEVKEEVVKYKVGAPARVGLVAPIDVIVPPGNTGLDPSQTSFFQVLNIPTKINKGTIEIITPVELIKKGDKVGSSEASLLSKLGIRPFSYGLIAENVYDNGSVFSPEVLDLTGDVLVSNFVAGVSMVSSLALAVSYPTLAAAPHMLINGFKNLLAFAISSEYSFKVKEYPKGLEYNSPSSDEEDPVMTREQRDVYRNSVRESDGFDVIRPDGVVEFGIISPKSLERKDLVFHTKMAIEVFNKTSHKDVEGELVFDKVLKAMAQAICGIRFYLTFNAKNLLKNDICTYQAVVLRGSGRDDEVESFRAMPSGSKKEYFWETHLSC